MPERLGEPHVPDPRDEALVYERLADESRLIAPAEPDDYLGGARRRREEVGSEIACRPVAQREHRPVPLRRLPLATSQNEPRRPSPLCVGASPNPPAAVHAEVAPDDHAALEAEEQMLPDRSHRLEPAAVDTRSDTCHPTARVRAFGLDPFAHEHLQATGRTMERVTLRHAPSVPESNGSTRAT